MPLSKHSLVCTTLLPPACPPVSYPNLPPRAIPSSHDHTPVIRPLYTCHATSCSSPASLALSDCNQKPSHRAVMRIQIARTLRWSAGSRRHTTQLDAFSLPPSLAMLPGNPTASHDDHDLRLCTRMQLLQGIPVDVRHRDISSQLCFASRFSARASHPNTHPCNASPSWVRPRSAISPSSFHSLANPHRQRILPSALLSSPSIEPTPSDCIS